MKITVALLVAMSLPGVLEAPAYAADPSGDAGHSALQSTIDTCATCHGAKGHSVSPAFPNLAAQSASYIETQLKAFKDQSRGEPDAQAFMWDMAAQLSEDRISALAAYFSAQPPAPGHAGNAKLVAQGRKLFEEGAPSRGVAPCTSCHGANAEGRAESPRLAGQNAPYLLKQLLVIQNALRQAPVMHGLIKDLTKQQMQAVVAYLESA